MPLTATELTALNAERDAAKTDARAAIKTKQDAATAALEDFYTAERAMLSDPWDPAPRAVADSARSAYTAARQALRDQLTTAAASIDQRVQAKIDDLTAT